MFSQSLSRGVIEIVEAYDLAVLNEGNRGRSLTDPAVEARVSQVLARMTLAQKVTQLHGTSIQPTNELYLTAGEPTLGVPAFKMVDGPRGARVGVATTFPVAMARGASFDPELERRVGMAIALEAKAYGANVLLAPAVNLLRHPGWGRAQETYGEDPLHVGRMAVGFIAGAQNHLVASVKHFALNSIENTRFEVDVQVDPVALHEVYLPHFRVSVRDAHVGSVMTAYNKVNGSYCAENATLVRETLKRRWGFRGFVESDWIFGTRSTVASALAGLDIEMPSANYYGHKLREAVERGSVALSVIDDAVSRVLRVKLGFGLDRDEPVAEDMIECAAHAELALEAAHKSIVLLKNERVTLPFDANRLSRVAVVGRLSDLENTGDRGSSAVRSSIVTTVLGGVRDHLPDVQVEHVGVDTLDAGARARLTTAEVAIVVVGLDYRDEGENIPFNAGGGDRTSLRLSNAQEILVREVSRLVPRTVVVLIAGSAVEVRPWIDAVPALLLAWYPGMLGGEAVADVLFGRVCPSGKLPISFARDVRDLPAFDPVSKAVRYDYAHGAWHLESQGTLPEFPFGFGLSYTRFEYSDLTVEQRPLEGDVELTVCVCVKNIGPRAGDEVVQLYVRTEAGRVPRRLCGFGRLSLSPGEQKCLRMRVRGRDLAGYDVATGEFSLHTRRGTLFVGSNSRELPLFTEYQIEPVE